MPFALRDVGLECFALMFKGEDVGSVFATEDDPDRPWIVLLTERLSGKDMPPPFTAQSHRFGTRAEIEAWLGISRCSVAA